MKRIFLVLSVICFGLCSCNESIYKEVDGRMVEIVDDNTSHIRYIEFDDHEYVYYKSGHRGSLCHSPKCHCLNDYKK
jgi:hypothetical protein